MGNPYSEIDDLLREVERARQALGRIKARQIRNLEHRDFFKATALSWFHTRRPSISTVIPPELLDSIDSSYREILDASERNASKNTYAGAIKTARAALTSARTRILIVTPVSKTTESPPNFTALVADATMSAILARRWLECQRCIEAEAPLAAIVMMGGLLEALLVARANKLTDKSRLFKSAMTPLDYKTKKPLELKQWTLGPYIDVGHDLQWMSNAAKQVAVILRDYRNYIHPEKERSHGISLTPDDAAMLWEVTKTLSRELVSLKGVV